MTWLRAIAVAVPGLALVALGLVLALVAPGPTSSPFYLVGVVLLGFFAVLGALWKLRGNFASVSDAPSVPWAGEDPFATPAPERTPDTHPLSSGEFAAVVRDAGDAARRDGTVADGIAVVRPALREALGTALVRGGLSREDALNAMAEGSWTDDPVAASVLDSDFVPPDRSLTERVAAWLFPERVVRRRTRRAMQAVAGAADDALPTVPGQTAPRNVPVVRPRLEELNRGADGRLQRAVDPLSVARGPRPSEPDLEVDSPVEDGTPETGRSRNESIGASGETTGSSGTPRGEGGQGGAAGADDRSDDEETPGVSDA